MKSQIAKLHIVILMFWVPLLSGSKPATAQVIPQDSLALVAFYNSTNGAGWNDNTNWLTANPVSTWFGITVTGDRVTRLDMVGNFTTGSLPPEIGDLTGLDYIRISNSLLGGTIPDEIGNLTNLTELWFFANQLSGPMPDTLFSMTGLLVLNLNSNNLTGTIPAAIGNMTNLATFIAGGNNFVGTLPPEMGNLVNIFRFQVNSNQLSGGIPAEVGNMASLTHLFVHYNQFTEPLPDEIGNLTNLTDLRIRNNQFPGDLPDTLRNLTSINTLHVQSNLFTGLPDLSPLTSLANLNTEDNRLTFEDIEPNIGVASTSFTYSPQDSIGIGGDTTVALGSPLTISVSVGGTANQYQWFKSGAPIPGENSPSLVIPSISNPDTGSYHCEITNTIATELTLYSRPVTVQVGGPLTPRELDSLALVALYNSTDGANWTDNTNWLTANPFSAWFGVTAPAGRVTNLGLASNNLSGPLPSEIGNLTELTNLNLGGNPITGMIPVEIGNLVNLTSIQVFSGQLTGPLPDTIYSMTNLSTLWLYNNQLSGTLSPSIGDLTNLTALNLGLNDFSGPLPQEIWSLTNLNFLRLDGNDLTGTVPPEFGNMTSLGTFLIGGNQLSGTIPPEIGNLSSMSNFSIYGNNFTGDMPAGITNFTNVTSLDASFNAFTSFPDMSPVAPFSALRIDNNRLTFESIEPNVGVATIYTYSPQDSVGSESDTTVLEGTPVSFTVSVGGAANQYQWFRNGSMLPGETSTDLTLPSVAQADSGSYHCEITNTIAAALTLYSRPAHLHVLPSTPLALDSLALVDLYNSTDGANWTDDTNWLTANPLSTWNGVSVSGGRVSGLSLNSNGLNGPIPPSIGNLTAMTSLFMSNNALSGNIPAETGNLAALTTLNLAGNDLTGSIPIEITTLTGLSSLFLLDNQLSGSIPSEFENMTALQTLALSTNNLTGAIPSELGNLSNLQSLQLNTNQLSGPLPGNLMNLTGLTTLWLGNNQLSGTIPVEMGNLINLSGIQIANNQFTGSIPDTLGSLSTLVIFDVQNNQLSGAVPSALGNLVNLTSMYFDNNNFTGSVPGSFVNLVNLETLRINGNEFLDFPNLSTLSLSTLRVQNNRLTFEDIEPNVSVAGFVYSPQDSIGSARDTTLDEGDPLTISVTVGGTANQYQWYKDGSQVPGATNASLVLAAVVPGDAGAYHCQITNTIATALTLNSRPVNLTVIPVVTNQPPFVNQPVPDTIIDEDFGTIQLANLSTVFDDPDLGSGDSLTFSASLSDPIAVVNITGGFVELTSMANANGFTTLILTATDLELASASDTVVIEITPVNDAPSNFSVLDPVWNWLTNNLTPTFTWTSSIDADDDVLMYTLQFSDGPAFGSILYQEDTPDTTLTIGSPLDSLADYYWRVTAADGNGGTASSDSGFFRIDAVAPDMFLGVLGSPVVPTSVSLYLHASEPLTNPQAAFDFSSADTSGQLTVDAEPLADHDNVYFVPYQLPGDGELSVTLSAEDAAGNSAEVTRLYSVGQIAKDRVFVLTAPNGSIELNAPKQTVDKDGFILLGVGDAAETPAGHGGWTGIDSPFDLVSTATLKKPVRVKYRYASETVLASLAGQADFDERKIGLYSETNGAWIYAGGEGVSGEVTASVGAGTFRLFFNPDHVILPDRVELFQNYPNPFNPSTTIRFAVPEEARVSLVIYNILGQEVRTVADAFTAPGYHELQWNGRNGLGKSVASGVYIYRLVVGKSVFTRKMMLIR